MATKLQCEQETPGNGHYRFKILVPSIAAGAIIGKGGETISQLQKDTGTRIIMSKNHDFYPGTNERVCLISGRVEGILSCLEFIMEKCKEKPDHIAVSSADKKTSVEREKQVKILIPNSTASMIIGERGSFIKQMKKESGAVVQISQKCSDPNLIPRRPVERCITVTGDFESNRKACLMILEKIVEDPHSGICSNVSYVDVPGPVANSNPTGSPFACSDVNSSGSMKSPCSNSSSSSVCNASQKSQNTGAVTSPTNSADLVLGSNSAFIENVGRLLRVNGYVEHAVSEITFALTTLESLGVLNFILTVLNNFAVYGFQQMPYHPLASNVIPAVAVPDVSVPARVTGMNASFDSVVNDRLSMEQNPGLQHFPESSRYHHPFLTETEAAAFDPVHSSSSPTVASSIVASLPVRNSSIQAEWNASLQSTLDGQHMTSSNDAMMGETAQIDIEIPETIVGAILGQGGKVLVEIQQLSGANVQISKKGIFAPGTLNRIVSITGSPNAICTAQSLIEQRVAEAKLKRGQQSAFETQLTNSYYNIS